MTTTDFTRYFRSLVAALGRNPGWYGVFAGREPAAARAYEAGAELPPWDVVRAVLHDLGAAAGGQPDPAEVGRAAALYAAAVAEWDAAPGAEQALRQRLEATVRAYDVALLREREAARALDQAAASPGSEATARLSAVHAWARDDRERAAARRTALHSRLASLPPRHRDTPSWAATTDPASPIPPARRLPSDAEPPGYGAPPPAARRGPMSGGTPGAEAASRAAPPADPASRMPPGQWFTSDRDHPAPATETAPAFDGISQAAQAPPPGHAPTFRTASEPRTSAAPAAGQWPQPAPGAPGAWATEGDEGTAAAMAARGPAPAPQQRPQAAPAASGTRAFGGGDSAAAPELQAGPTPGAERWPQSASRGRLPGGGDPAAAPAPQTGPAPAAGRWPQSASGGPAVASEPQAGTVPAGSGRRSRRTPGGARFAGAPAPAPQVPAPRGGSAQPPSPALTEQTADAARRAEASAPRVRAPRGARFAGAPDTAVPGAPAPVAPSAASGPAPRGARFAGAPAATEDPAPRQSDPRWTAEARAAARRLGELRAAGDSGAAYVLLCEAATGPAGRLPYLVRELERAGLHADVATMLWETAAQPPEALAAAASALSAQGRGAECRTLLHQAAARPAADLAAAAAFLADSAHPGEAAELLETLARTRPLEDAVAVARSRPRLTTLLLDAAARVSQSRRLDVAAALRRGGLPAS